MAVVYQVILTPDAQQAIRHITDYLIQEVSLTTALKVNTAIIETIKSLKTFPERNTVAKNISKQNTIYRRVMAMSYRIVYTIDKDKIQVIIVDVDYGKRDPKRLEDKFS